MLILLMYVSYRYLATISINALTRCKVFVVTYNYVIISKVAYFSINQSITVYFRHNRPIEVLKTIQETC